MKYAFKKTNGFCCCPLEGNFLYSFPKTQTIKPKESRLLCSTNTSRTYPLISGTNHYHVQAY